MSETEKELAIWRKRVSDLKEAASTATSIGEKNLDNLQASIAERVVSSLEGWDAMQERI